MLRRKMIHQKDFYQALESSESKTGLKVIKAFKQGGGSLFSGYLPSYSKGTCEFTVLDYFRAGTQNCLNEWLNHPRSLFKTSQHAARQQYLFMNREGCASDPLFLATSQQVKDQDLKEDDFVSIEKEDKNDLGYMESKELYSISNDPFLKKSATRIYDIYKDFIAKNTDQKSIPPSIYAPCIELTFNVNDGSQHIAMHTTGFILEPPGNQKPPHLLFLDPNVGVVKVPLAKENSIQHLLHLVQNHLYKDFQLKDIAINQKIPSWIKNIDPILNGETKKIEKNIHHREIDYIDELKKYEAAQKELEKTVDTLSVISLDDSDSEEERTDTLEKKKDSKNATDEEYKKNKTKILYYAFDPIANTITPVNQSKESDRIPKKLQRKR